MASRTRTLYALAAVVALPVAAAALSARDFKFDLRSVEQIVGSKGRMYQDAEPVFKIVIPREDMKQITVRGIALDGLLGVNSWVSFQQLDSGNIMLMGDLALYADEVNPVMDAFFKSRIEVTALAPHYLHDEPRVYFMHITGGNSKAEPLARGVHNALEAVKDVRKKNSLTASAVEPAFAASSMEPGRLDEVLRTRGQVKDGMYRVVFARQTKLPCGCPMGENMGINTWAVFAGTNADAVVTGQFAALDGELQATLRTLRENGIEIVAIHNALENETPRVLLVNFWTRGNAEEKAEAIRLTLEKQKAARASR